MTITYHRHVMIHGICWCGSTHSWALAKDGYCDCVKFTCREVHHS